MNRFIAGSNNIQLLQSIVNYKRKYNWNPIIDYAKESAKNEHEANLYIDKLKDTIQYLNKNYNKELCFALKISSFSNVDTYNKINNLINFMSIFNVSKVFLDAENVKLKDLENSIYYPLIKNHNKNNIFIYKTYQMYLKNSFYELQHDIENFNVGVKLVRGAYIHQDKDKDAIFNNILDTHTNYNNAVKFCINNNSKLLIATHNKESIIKALNLEPNKDNVEFAQLLGMNNQLSQFINSKGYKVFKYMPYGSFKETLPYLSRRLIENYKIIRFLI
jgi:proline dehydrogenase